MRPMQPDNRFEMLRARMPFLARGLLIQLHRLIYFAKGSERRRSLRAVGQDKTWITPSPSKFQAQDVRNMCRTRTGTSWSGQVRSSVKDNSEPIQAQAPESKGKGNLRKFQSNSTHRTVPPQVSNLIAHQMMYVRTFCAGPVSFGGAMVVTPVDGRSNSQVHSKTINSIIHDGIDSESQVYRLKKSFEIPLTRFRNLRFHANSQITGTPYQATWEERVHIWSERCDHATPSP
ncbi:hypothetical protein CC1G_14720 [Coprinopsis cinerea okayama7|uniref:Uncharacterized protein n=1 Tax=Coprinopsis cinerea (strain Okayama-7 / 130 / ATCC MYA-4618 / FGSC 9003) TaxID=240176 RepID=D6RN09_COPC7|nr:hypothetical protein CC1G_14720 [Coprinopsis cinerea okayama7\|eukprot:XP_002911291.1 hypothetical protein CC1G_14720 [Coprinopsis cinerea okayama7\